MRLFGSCYTFTSTLWLTMYHPSVVWQPRSFSAWYVVWFCLYPYCCRSPGDCWRRHSFGSASQRWWEKVAICWSSCCRKTYQRLLQVCAWLAVIWYPSCAFSFCDFITLSFLFFFFFSKDWFLRYVYRAASAQLSIAGLQAIKWKNRRMINADLSELVRPRFTWVFLRWNCWLL